MTAELKIFSGALFAKDKALRKDPSLKTLAISVKAPNKAVAEAIMSGKLAENHPENLDDYFKAKVWHHGEDLPQPPLDSFCAEFFGVVAEWDSEKGLPVAISSGDAGEEVLTDSVTGEKLKTVQLLGYQSRAACLAMYGPVRDITETQYSLVIDMINDEDGGFTRELAEAFSREKRVLELVKDRQIELLAHIRETVPETAQWTDINKVIVKWLDTPADKREQVNISKSGAETGKETHTESGCTLGGGNPTDRDYEHNLNTLRREVCKGILAISMDFDIYNSPVSIEQRAQKMDEEGTDPRFTAWWKQFRQTPGILDYSLAANIALIKTSPEAIHQDPVLLRQYINKHLTESDHAKPSQEIIDIACGRSSFPLPMNTVDNSAAGEGLIEQNASIDGEKPEVESTSNVQIQEVKRDEKPAGDAMQPGEGDLDDGKATDAPVNDTRPLPSDRDIEIAFALNDLFSGHTNIVRKDDIESLVGCTGHLIPHIFSLLINDIITTEYCLSPDFSDEEIQDVSTTILETWSDDISIRQKIALDAIVEFRRPAPPKAAVLKQPTVKSKKVPEPPMEPAALTYRQQLTIAAIKGMCANPAYRGDFDELPQMAIMLADEVINAEAAQ